MIFQNHYKSYLRSPFLFSPKPPYFHTIPRISLILRAIIAVTLLSLIANYIFVYSSIRVHDIIDSILGGPADERTAWIEKSFASDIDGEFNGKAIKSLCVKKRWDHRVAISCGRIQGGVGNARNVVLTCLRFAIEAGGDFVIPNIQSRSEVDLSILDTGNALGFDYMFDEAHLKKSLGKFCPGMKVYGGGEKVWTDQDSISLGPSDLVPNHQDRVLTEKEAAHWSGYFEKWLLNQEATNADKLSSGPIPVEFESPLLEWPVNYDNVDFVRNFGRVIQFREDARRLAATVLYELSTKFELDLEPTEFMTRGMFFGAHLRTAKDAAKAHWTGYDLQAMRYLEQAHKEHLSFIYVATGSAEDMERFAKQAWSEYQYNTTSKLHLLQGDDLVSLQGLSWDQQGLVDFLVMLKSSSFGGIEMSSFAWNIALKRHILSSDANYLVHGEALQDEYSTLLGPNDDNSFFARAMWP